MAAAQRELCGGWGRAGRVPHCSSCPERVPASPPAASRAGDADPAHGGTGDRQEDQAHDSVTRHLSQSPHHAVIN